MSEGLSVGGTLGAGGPREGWALAAGDVLGGYRVVKPLGRGGMGEVYLVENVAMGKRYALKLLPRALTDARREASAPAGAAAGGARGREEVFTERFRREARVMADLSHPNIVDVHHMAEDAGRHFLIMDYVEGPGGAPRTLAGEIAERGALGAERTKGLALELCDALAAAHAQGVLHRDIKPQNVLLGADGRSLLTDFGLAKVLGTGAGPPGPDGEEAVSAAGTLGGPTVPGSALGTPGYMSPEQEQGAELDERSDVFALGEVIYAMLMGHRPAGIPTMPSERGFPAGWDAVVRGCLAESPGRRFAGAGEVAAALRAVDAPAVAPRGGEKEEAARAAPSPAPVEPRELPPDGTGTQRAGRRRRRRAWLAIAAAGVALWVTRDVWTQPQCAVLRGHEGGAAAVAFSPAGRVLATAGRDGSVALWPADAPDPAVERRLDAGEGGVTSLAWSPDGTLLAAGNEYHTVTVWVAADGSRRATLAGHEGPVRSVAVSGDGLRLASVGADGALLLWSLPAGEILARDEPQGSPTCVAFSPDGGALVVGHAETGFLGRKGFATLRDGKAATIVHMFGGENHVVAAAFSADGAYLATAEDSQGILGGGSYVRLWNVASRKELRSLSCGQRGRVTCVAFSPDGRHVATGSIDETASVWDFSSGRRLLRLGTALTGHRGAVRALAFSPDGRRLATASEDATARVWELPERFGPRKE